MYTPTWAEHEKDMHAEDTELQIKAGLAFEAERTKEMANSRLARDWEEGRKKEWNKNKPAYTKKRIQTEQNKMKDFFNTFKKLGNFKSIKPSMGYILVAVDKDTEFETSSGIVLTGDVKEPNTGIVMGVGADIITPNGNKIWCEVSKGDHILFKLGAGAFAGIEGTDARLMMFSDVLGIIEK